MLTISCPECSQKLNVPAQVVGKLVKCEACRHSFVASAAELSSPALPKFEPPGGGPNLSARRRGQRHARYPWLEAYLAWIRSAAVVTFFIGIGGATFVFVKGFNMDPSVPPFTSYELMGGAVVAALVSVFELVAAFATTEFIRVVMDIESSTRAIAQQRAA